MDLRALAQEQQLEPGSLAPLLARRPPWLKTRVEASLQRFAALSSPPLVSLEAE
jgi:hypothetical protein